MRIKCDYFSGASGNFMRSSWFLRTLFSKFRIIFFKDASSRLSTALSSSTSLRSSSLSGTSSTGSGFRVWGALTLVGFKTGWMRTFLPAGLPSNSFSSSAKSLFAFVFGCERNVFLRTNSSVCVQQESGKPTSHSWKFDCLLNLPWTTIAPRYPWRGWFKLIKQTIGNLTNTVFMK